jgi:HD-GYP domain-containing protein (c-di-GMP phosphodiesterase class II)
MASRVGAVELQSLRRAEDVRRLYRQLRRAVCHSLLGLASALEAKDMCTRGHSERVGASSGRLAGALGLSPAQIDMVTQAGLLHDIGKIGVPETVLRKRGPLDLIEWGLVRNHALIGAQIVAPFDFFAGSGLAIRHHHERWDGSGYPDGLAGRAIPLGARIVAVADVFDALTSDRVYRQAFQPDEARALMGEGRGTQFDADLLDLFFDSFDDVLAIRRAAGTGTVDQTLAIALAHASGHRAD